MVAEQTLLQAEREGVSVQGQRKLGPGPSLRHGSHRPRRCGLLWWHPRGRKPLVAPLGRRARSPHADEP